MNFLFWVNFYSQYYLSQEFQGAPVVLIQNIDRYIKLNNNANIVKSTTLRSDINQYEKTIFVGNTKWISRSIWINSY